MKILITGGSGFIGIHLIEELLKREDVSRIYNIDIKSCEIADPRFTHFDHNILNPLNFEIESLDVCIHLAALCKEPGFEWHEYFETNHLGTVNVLKFCEENEIKRLLFTSTMMVFKAGDARREESDITCPDTAYGISKLLAEKEIQHWATKTQGWFKIIRPAVVFGKNENGNFTRMYNALEKGFFPYVGRKTTVKCNIYVKELVDFLLFLLTQKTRYNLYNFAFPNEGRMSDIVSSFKQVFNLKSFNPVFPFKLLLMVSYGFEWINKIGFKNSIHHRRIEKLYYSSNIHPKNALKDGYTFRYDLLSALEDWKENDQSLFKR